MEILRIHTKKKMLDSDVDLRKIVELTEGWTGADIGNMVNTAALSAIKERITSDSISRQDQQQGKNEQKKAEIINVIKID